MITGDQWFKRIVFLQVSRIILRAFFVAFSFRGDGLITSWQIASSDKYNLFIGSGSSSTKVMIHPYGTRCQARENYQQVFRNNCGTDTLDA
jgi:hypothetical protein